MRPLATGTSCRRDSAHLCSPRGSDSPFGGAEQPFGECRMVRRAKERTEGGCEWRSVSGPAACGRVPDARRGVPLASRGCAGARACVDVDDWCTRTCRTTRPADIALNGATPKDVRAFVEQNMGVFPAHERFAQGLAALPRQPVAISSYETLGTALEARSRSAASRRSVWSSCRLTFAAVTPTVRTGPAKRFVPRSPLKPERSQAADNDSPP